MWQQLSRWWQRRPGGRRQHRNGTPLTRAQPRLEALEDRLALSWGPVPPASITLPTNAVVLSLDSQGDAQGKAGISTDEVDYYTFVAPISGYYYIRAETADDFMDPVLGVYSGLGQRLGYDADTTLADHDCMVAGHVAAGDPLIFGITNLYGFSEGQYSWSVDGPAEGTGWGREDLIAPRPFSPLELKEAQESIKPALLVETVVLFPEQLQPDERFVYQLHLDLLGRAPSYQTVTTLAGRIAQGTSRFDIAAEIVNDTAYRRVVVEDLYATFLGRTMTSTDYAVLSATSTYVNPALSFPGLPTRETVAAYLVSSTEYYQGRGSGTDDGWLDALYQDALARMATQPERDAFHQAGSGQAARQAVALALFQGQEYRERLVESFYQQYLRRPSDPGGLAYWVGQLHAGHSPEAVLASLLESQDYYDYCNR